ncbi:protein FAR1-RELATED SEQUENCE 3-like [Triticum aestivum]|uniref:protein FAR1-RELATED SEQUENCE 3-like n=1 Tax=Triticum aestivum TaxID=4565 RepID=UPI001D025B98|nr:protein FAR1-RELATED SEQUENCE 3-like [Triticum aestivum]
MALIGSDDTAAVLEELRRWEDKDDPEHFHQYEVDAEGRLKRLFWADADSRISSVRCSDGVVVIDTVFRTNRYGAAFVPFLGMNHHRRPVLLGCGVLADQSPGSHFWLLRAFMMSTCQEKPKSVITDGGDAVVQAVQTVADVGRQLLACGVRGAMTQFRGQPQDGEQSGVALQDVREEGALGRRLRRFVRDKFFLGLARDQSTECLCLSSGLRSSFSEDMTLLALLRRADFRCNYMRAQQTELDEEADKSRVELTTEHEYLEEDATRSFTPANFAIVLEEIKALDDFKIVDTLSSSSGDKVYTLDLHGELFNVLQSDDRADRCDGVVFKCSCRKMERDGLPCRHILHVLRHERASTIPKCEMEALGRQVFDLALRDANEFEEIKGFLQDWLQERRGHCPAWALRLYE